MKRTLLLLLMSIGVCLVFAVNSEFAPTQSRQAFNITSKAADHMDITFTLPEFELEELTVGDNTYHRILMPDAGCTLESGFPELPTIGMSLAIPRRGSFNLEALNFQQTVLTQYLAYPVQQGQELESPKSFVLNADFYASGSAYPTAAIEYSDPMILRDFRIVTLQINPFSYNPVTQELTVRQNIDFRINFTPEPGLNELEGELLSVSPAFANIYEAVILNFDDYRYQMYASTPPRYLIIYGNNTDANFTTALNAFVLWKRQKGADVDVANTSSGSAGS
ncbi:MAG TPA: C25 family peptidase propeptide domain-containing protein, partial [Candidatus Syntrophosphaera sp.]|nr:C25 family peptidase propeptide domain-containing protein [Candidatus Syntrophosphaera sp.]